MTALEAAATPDFYGVKMKSEDFAQNVFLIEAPKIPDFTNERPGTDKRVYAYGYMSSFLGGGKGIAIEVFNHSDAPMATDKLFRELIIVTYDGRRYDRGETEMMWSRARLGPGQRATFNYKFPGARIHREEVRMIICSFDLGQTSIFLFPLRHPEKAAPAAVPETVPTKEKVAKKKPAAFVEQCLTPVKVVQSFFRGVGERLGGKKPEAQGAAAQPGEGIVIVKASPDYPLVKPEQVIEGVHYQFSPDFRKQVQAAEKTAEETVYRDRPWSLDGPDKSFIHTERAAVSGGDLPRREAKVLIVNSEYGFVVVDAGFENGFGKNVILDVIRAGRRVGKVLVTKPRDRISGAVILPEWRTRDEIRVGDIVGMSK